MCKLDCILFLVLFLLIRVSSSAKTATTTTTTTTPTKTPPNNNNVNPIKQTPQQTEYSHAAMVELIRTVATYSHTLEELRTILTSDKYCIHIPNVDTLVEQIFHDVHAPKQNYDLELRIDSFKSLNDGVSGWALNYGSEDGRERLEDYTIAVGISGSLFNVGKSWLLKKLVGTDYGVGVLKVTQGLSFVQVDGVLYVDSMGKNRPLINIPSEERIVMDLVVQDFLMLTSNLFIYVTGPLLATEIREIDEVYKTLVQKNPKALINPIMYVVHNFKDFKFEEEVNKHIKDDILDALQAEEMAEGIWQSHNSKVYHVVLAQDGSPAASTWNDRTISFLKDQIDGQKNNQERHNIESVISETIDNLMHQYLYVPGTNKTLPVFFDPIERVISGRSESYVYEKWTESIADAKLIIKDKMQSLYNWLWPPGEGEQGKPENPFEVKVYGSASNTWLRLVHKQDELFYAPLGRYKELDKSFPTKKDIIENKKSYNFVIDLPGVKAANLNFTCETDVMMSVEGIRDVPDAYHKYLNEKSKLRLQERRFNNFIFKLALPVEGLTSKFKCENHNYRLVDGVLYLSFPVSSLSSQHPKIDL